MRFTIRSTGAILALLAAAGAAHAETTDCTEISAAPYSITAPGVYCLKSSLTGSVAGSAINVDSDDVRIDLNGHTLSGFTFFGVNSQSSRKNITVRNGTIRGGRVGLELVAADVTVEDLRVEGSSEVGIMVEGKNAILRRNTVVGVTGPADNSCCAYGIYVNSPLARISDNRVLDTGVGRTGESEAIKLVGSPGAVIERNQLANAVKTTGFYPLGIMVASFGGAKVTVVGNSIANFGTGIWVTVSQTALLLDNTVANAVTPFTGGGILAGTTNYSF